MNLSNDKDFDLAVDKAIDEIFGLPPDSRSPSEGKTLQLEEEEEVPTLELESVDSPPPSEEGKVIEFPSLEDLLEPKVHAEQEHGLGQKDLENLAAMLLGLEWELSLENCVNFLTALEKAKQKSPRQLHEIFDVMYEVAGWLRDRSHEAKPEWLHFLHQGIVALNLVTLHGKSPEPYIRHLRQVLGRLSSALKKSPDELLQDRLLHQIVSDYQRFVLFKWLFSRSPKLKGWQSLSQKALQEIEKLVNELPEEQRPDLKKIAENALKKIQEGRAFSAREKRLPFKEAYICEQNLQKYVIPAEEVCFIGPMRDKWQELLATGQFPLKALLPPWCLLPFVKLRNRLSGELSEFEENELKRLKLRVPENFRQGEILLILWKNSKGMALAVDDAEPVNIPKEARITDSNQLILGHHKYPILTVQKGEV